MTVAVHVTLRGGPYSGTVALPDEIVPKPFWTIHVVHGNCTCQHCKAKVIEARLNGISMDVFEDDIRYVTHVYERRDDDIFAWRDSFLGAPDWPPPHSSAISFG